MKHRSWRIWVTAGLLLACYTVHMDERQVRATAAADLDCEESFIELQTDDSDKVDVAHYTARGCGKHQSYQCTTDEQGYVTCQHPGHGGDSSGGSNVAGDVAAGAIAAGAGCACASLLGSKGGGGGGGSGGSGGGSVPATPVRTR